MQSLGQAFEETIRGISDARNSAGGRLQSIVNVMDTASRVLLAEWEQFKLTPEAHEFAKTHPLDRFLTRLLVDLLWADERTRGDAVLGEELVGVTDPRESAAEYVWLTDAIDNTNGLLSGKPDFGSALMAFERRSGIVGASLFALPAMATVYVASGTAAWRNGRRLARLSEATEGRPRKAVVRRPRGEIPANIENQYREAEERLGREGYEVTAGQTLTALDVLSLAEAGGPSKFLYFAKMWDLLIAASVAHSVGATVRFYPGGEDVFPLSEELIQRARTGARALIMIEQP